MIPKFRAWINEGNHMIYTGKDTPWCITFNSSYDDRVRISDYMIRYEVSPSEVMRSTGLTDKNGVEIYERDIVRVTNDEGRTDFSDGGIGTVCELEELGMWYIDGQVHNGLFDINHCYYIEVIGNVYENAELLEVAE